MNFMSMKNNNVPIIILSVVSVLLLACNMFTAYLYIDAKNTLIKNSQTMAEYKGKADLYQKDNDEFSSLKQKYDESVKLNEELDGRIEDLTKDNIQLTDQLEAKQSTAVPSTHIPVQKPVIDKPIKANNPSNAVTVGSSKEHVRKVMGNPSSVVLTSWWYGKQSWISFDNNGLVVGWYNGGNNLKTK